MSDHRDIYRSQASEYELLVSREDYQKNLPRALGRIRPLDGLDVVELGAGTGRLTCLMAPSAKSLLVSDILNKGHIPTAGVLFRLADCFGTGHREILQIASILPYDAELPGAETAGGDQHLDSFRLLSPCRAGRQCR